tara:strand:- start:46 stop:498 length:453 start_codon:yes stop_codon:yes gene_type:complete
MLNLKKYGKYALTIVFVFLTVFLFLRYIHNKGRSIFIGKSPIHGNGVFADRDFEKGEIILHDIFPNKPKGVRFYDNVSLDMFNKSLSIEGKYINHCSKNYNADVISDDYQIYKLISTKKIKEGTEITANYNRVNRNYPFIGRSGVKYVSC